MSSLMKGLLGQLKPFGERPLFWASKTKLGQVVLRGASKRAYTFEVYRPTAASALGDVSGVYCYARTAAGGGAADGYDILYVGRSAGLARDVAAHERLGHVSGLACDALLLLRIPEDGIRRDLEQDLVARYRPPFNELLGGDEGAEAA